MMPSSIPSSATSNRPKPESYVRLTNRLEPDGVERTDSETFSEATASTIESSPHHDDSDQNHHEDDDATTPFLKGEVQPAKYQDVYFAYMFWIHVAVFVAIAALYAPAAFTNPEQWMPNSTAFAFDDQSSMTWNETYFSFEQNFSTDDDAGSSTTYIGFSVEKLDSNASADDDAAALFEDMMLASAPGSAEVTAEVTAIIFRILGLIISTFVAGAVVTFAFLKVISRYPTSSMYIALATGPALLLVTGLLLVATSTNTQEGQSLFITFLILTGLAALWSALLLCCYRRYIPFAGSTIVAAMEALDCNRGLYGVSFGSVIVTYGWAVVWIITVIGLGPGKQVPCSDLGIDGDMCSDDPVHYFVHIVLIGSLVWTTTVIRNVVHCTTVGTVGSWWFFRPTVQRGSCCGACTQDMKYSFQRATTYSFGSICMGSLLLAIIEMMRSMARNSRTRRDASALLGCIMECLLACLAQFIEYFNSWAYVYVGLYGYSYWDSGKNVVQMFTNRGFSTFLTDRLIFKVLALYNMVGAIGTGCIAVVLERIWLAGAWSQVLGGSEGDDEDEIAAARIMIAVVTFWIGFLVGMIVSGTAMFVVESSVRTIIVCFAESPEDFQLNHPELYDNMKNGWAAIHPDSDITTTSTPNSGQRAPMPVRGVV